MEYRKQQFETYEAFGQQFSCDYSQPLARGGHGEVYRGVDLETNEEVAIKRRLYSPDSDLITLEKEYAHTQAVPPNRFVVRYVYYGRYATPFGTFEFLVMKFYRDGNLTRNTLPWAKLTEAQQRRFTEEFLKGLAHLHRHQVIHRDIKPENILLVKYIDADGEAYRPVIADFGISKLLTENPEAARAMQQNSMRVGTVTYMAPEQLRTDRLTYNADLWSFGIILYEIITGKYMIPRRSFPDLQREEAYTFWRNADEQKFPADMDTIPEPYQQIIRRCLLADPAERVQSTEELLTLLSLQPQLAEADRLIKANRTALAIEQLEAIDKRATLPSVSQKLNELRLKVALASSAEPPTPIADRPVEIDELDPPVVVEPVDFVPTINAQPVPVLPSSFPSADDDQRTQQFTEQLDPAWFTANNRHVVSPFAAFYEPDDKAPTEAPHDADTPADKPATLDTDVPKPDATAIEASALTPDVPAPPVADSPFAPADDVPAPDRPVEGLDDEPMVEQPAADVRDVPADVPVAAAWSPLADERPAEPAPRKKSKGKKPIAPRLNVPADEAFLFNQPAQGADETMADEAVNVPAGLMSDVAAPVQTAARPATRQPNPLPIGEWVQDIKDAGQLIYDEIRTRKNSRILGIAGLGLIVASILIYSSGTSQPPEQNRQTAPVVSEDYKKALKLFKERQIEYEKTGQIDPYLWSFVHCNPDYDDSLSIKSAKVRSQLMVDNIRLLFPDFEGNVSGYKRQEMRRMLSSKIDWEKLPHDPNCAPGQLLENAKIE